MINNKLSDCFCLEFYGKVPSYGDFISNLSSFEPKLWWDSWFQKGLLAKDEPLVPASSVGVKRTPVWNFAIPDMGQGFVSIGCIVMSRDKFGREYPFVLFLPCSSKNYENLIFQVFNENSLELGRLLLDIVQFKFSVESIERSVCLISEKLYTIFSDAKYQAKNTKIEVTSLGSENEWKAIENFFEPDGAKSFWWTNAVNGVKKNHTHNSTLSNSLFSYLFSKSI